MNLKHASAILIAAAAMATTRSGASAGLQLTADVAIRETEGGLELFVAAPSRGAPLLYASLPPYQSNRADRRSIPLGALSPATPCGSYDRAVAVAVRSARLVVVQAEPTPTVHECDLISRTTRVLLRGEPLRMPTAAAIAANGTIAVLDRGLRAIVAIGGEQKINVVRVGESPSLLRADDLGQLYAFDAEARGVIPVQLGASLRESFGSAPQAQQSRGGLSSNLLPLAAEPATFAIYRDVFYVTDTSGPTRAMLSTGRLSLDLPNVRPRLTAIAASRSLLATLDGEASSVELIDRPIPAGVTLDPTRGNPNEAWIDLLEDSATRQLLSRDRVQVTPADDTYDDVLRRNGVLLKVDLHPEKVAVPAGRTKSLFCALNPTLCDAGYSRQLPYVVIPRAAPQPSLETATRTLDDKDVRTWVDERVLLSAHRKDVTDAYLATRNAGVSSSLEGELSRRQMILATPMNPALGAGTIVRIVDGREEVVGNLSGACALEPTLGRTSLIAEFSAPRAAVPSPGPVVSTPRADMIVGAWTRSSVSLSALQKCRPPEGPPDRYLITESLAASDVRVASTDTAGAASRNFGVMPGPLFVGYKAVPLTALSVGVTIPIVDPARVKPLPSEGSTNLWSVRKGSFTLPLTRWRVDLLVPSSDSYAAAGALKTLQKKHPSLDVSSRERLDRSASSTLVAVTGWAGDIPATLEQARSDLAKVIRYDEALAAASGSEDVYIGVVENSKSVNLDHAGFSADGQSAWYDLADGTVLQPHRPPDPPPALPLTLQRADRDTEHGTHVAGIIAARRPPSLTLGLLPKTRLYLVPGNSTGDLKENIQKARDQQVYLFNISQGFEEGTKDTTLQDLDEQMEQRWRDALFIVAAGNDGADFNVKTPPRPVLWAASLPNVLTVGASDEKGENVLGQHQDGTDAKEPGGSNFGSRYVDLLAPGRMIHSLGKNGYAYACGSSQATPQVTAAAAMLFSLFSRPEIIRARLIYTADWLKPNFDKKVWGGVLNVHRAVFEPNKNVFLRPDKTDWEEIKLAGVPTVKIRGDLKHRDGSSSTFNDDKFPFSRILRLISLGGARYRIALLSKPEDVLVFVEGTVTGSVLCSKVKKWDQNTQTFSLDPDVPVNCSTGLSIGQFQDYVAAKPASVKFK